MLELEDLLEEQQALIDYSISANPNINIRSSMHRRMEQLEKQIAVASLKLEKKESLIVRDGKPILVELIREPFTKFKSIFDAARQLFINESTLRLHFTKYPTTPYMDLIPSVNRHLI